MICNGEAGRVKLAARSGFGFVSFPPEEHFTIHSIVCHLAQQEGPYQRKDKHAISDYMFLPVSVSTSAMMCKAYSNQVPSLWVGVFPFCTPEPCYFPLAHIDRVWYALMSIWKLRNMGFLQSHSISRSWTSFLHLLSSLSYG